MLEQVTNLIESGRNIFITGGGGVGKSYTLNKLRDLYPEMVVTSTTGISAINIEGQTIHSWAGIGIANQPIKAVLAQIRSKPEKVEYLQDTKLLAIDEISMLDSFTFEYIDEVLRIIRGVNKPFGGIQLILIGDFFQLPPVGIEKGKDFCFKSKLWEDLNLKVINLKKVYRQKDKKLIEALNHIRTGLITDEDYKLFKQRDNIKPTDKAVRLFPTNNQTDYYNSIKFQEIKEPEKTFWSSDKIFIHKKGEQQWLRPNDSKVGKVDKAIFDKFSDSCNLPRVINLKIGARVMLLSNDLDKGLVNGSCGYVKDMHEKYITIEFDNGVIDDIKRIELEYYHNNQLKASRTQFPLRLAYAITIHKSQGMSFDNIFVNLSKVFTFGQTYVALSRATSLDGLFLHGFYPNKIKANPEVIEFYKNLN